MAIPTDTYNELLEGIILLAHRAAKHYLPVTVDHNLQVITASNLFFTDQERNDRRYRLPQRISSLDDDTPNIWTRVRQLNANLTTDEKRDLISHSNYIDMMKEDVLGLPREIPLEDQDIDDLVRLHTLCGLMESEGSSIGDAILRMARSFIVVLSQVHSHDKQLPEDQYSRRQTDSFPLFAENRLQRDFKFLFRYMNSLRDPAEQLVFQRQVIEPCLAMEWITLHSKEYQTNSRDQSCAAEALSRVRLAKDFEHDL